jgi:hypothetical protein
MQCIYLAAVCLGCVTVLDTGEVACIGQAPSLEVFGQGRRAGCTGRKHIFIVVVWVVVVAEEDRVLIAAAFRVGACDRQMLAGRIVGARVGGVGLGERIVIIAHSLQWSTKPNSLDVGQSIVRSHRDGVVVAGNSEYRSHCEQYSIREVALPKAKPTRMIYTH